MKTTLRIARLELNNLVFSPLPWLVLVGFSLYCVSLLLPSISQEVLNLSMYGREFNLSRTHFWFMRVPGGLFGQTMSLLMVIIPLVCMGVISREVGSGTIKLLYSSPIRLSSIIIGKYLALLVFIALLMSVLFICILVGAFSIENFEFSSVMAGFIGLMLLAATIAAIAMFISTFSAYPVIDAIATIAVVYGLSLLYDLAKDVPLLSDILYWLVPERQTASTIMGLLSSKNIGYFLVLIAMFLALAYFNLLLKRQGGESKPKTRVKMLATLLAGVVAIYVLVQPQFMFYHDMTPNKRNELLPISQEVLGELKGKPIKLTKYVQVGGIAMMNNQLISHPREREIFDKYWLMFPQMKMEFVYFYKPDTLELALSSGIPDFSPDMSEEQALAKAAETIGISLDDLVSFDSLDLPESVVQQRGEQESFWLLEANDRYSTLSPRFNDMMSLPGEGVITVAFLALVQEPKVIGVVTGQGERSMQQAGPNNFYNPVSQLNNRSALINKGFSVRTIGLDQPVSEDVDILVIADPRQPFSEIELRHFNQYVQRGGNALLTTEPGNQPVFMPLLAPMGVQVSILPILNEQPGVRPEYIYPSFDHSFVDYFAVSSTPGNQVFTPSALVVDTQRAEHAGYKVKTLVSANRAEYKFEPDSFVDGEQLPIAVAMEREVNGQTQRIVIAGDTDIFTDGQANAMAPGNVRLSNGAVLPGVAKYLANDEYPLRIATGGNLTVEDKRVIIAYEQLPYLKFVMYVLIPGIFAFFGLTMLRKRARG